MAEDEDGDVIVVRKKAIPEASRQSTDASQSTDAEQKMASNSSVSRRLVTSSALLTAFELDVCSAESLDRVGVELWTGAYLLCDFLLHHQEVPLGGSS